MRRASPVSGFFIDLALICLSSNFRGLWDSSFVMRHKKNDKWLWVNIFLLYLQPNSGGYGGRTSGTD